MGILAPHGRRRGGDGPARLTDRAIVVHGLADAEAALAAAARLGVPLTLVSAPDGAASGGAGWFTAVVGRAAAAFPTVEVTSILDCGDRADLVQAALRHGLKHVRFGGRADVAARLADIARQCGATLYRRRPRALDLFGVEDRVKGSLDWLAGGGARPDPQD